MHQDHQSHSAQEPELVEGHGSEDGVLHITTRLIDAVVRRTFGNSAGFVWAVVVPDASDPDQKRYQATTTLSHAHAVFLLRGLADAICRHEQVDEVPTPAVHICSATYRDLESGRPA